MELTTTRAADGAISTNTPGAPSGGFGDPSALFQALIKNRLQNGSKAAAAPAQPLSVRGARPQASEGMMRQTYTPSMGTQQSAPVKPAQITRRIPDPFASPYHKMATGQEIPMVSERYIEGVGWEFDGVDPRRQGGGGRGTIDTVSQPTGGYSSGPTTVDSDPRMAELVAQTNKARGVPQLVGNPAASMLANTQGGRK